MKRQSRKKAKAGDLAYLFFKATRFDNPFPAFYTRDSSFETNEVSPARNTLRKHKGSFMEVFTAVGATVINGFYIILRPQMVSGSTRGKRIGVRLSEQHMSLDGTRHIRGVNRVTKQVLYGCLSMKNGCGKFWYVPDVG